MTDLPDPDRLGEDEPAVDMDEDDNLEVVPEDLR